MPVVLALALLAAVVLFARAWLREFTYLMRLRDDAFPGHNDKLIWAILLIVLPPVGAWLFQTYREAHWPEAKPSKGPRRSTTDGPADPEDVEIDRGYDSRTPRRCRSCWKKSSCSG